VIRFEPEPTPERRAAVQAWLVAAFQRAITTLEQLPRRTRLKVWTWRP
jgi:hypothetical protein